MTKDDHRRRFGNDLRKARKEEDLTQAEVAKTMGCIQAYVSQAERGLVNPPFDTLIRFAAAVGRRFDFKLTRPYRRRPPSRET